MSTSRSSASRSSRAARVDTATRRVLALAFALAVAGAVVAGTTFLSGRHGAFPVDIPYAIICVGFVVAAAAPLILEIGTNSLSLSLSEIPLIVGLLSTPRPALLVAATGGSLIARALDRRMAPIKVAFNVPLTFLETCVTIAVFDWLCATPDPASVVTWAALISALGAAIVISTMAVNLVIVVTGDRLAWRQAVRHVLLGIANQWVALGIGVTAVLVASRNPVGLLLVATIGLLGVVPMRRLAALQRRYDDLQMIHEFAAALGRSHDLETTIARVAAETARVLRADGCLVRLPRPGLPPLHIVHGRVPVGLPGPLPDDANVLVRRDDMATHEGLRTYGIKDLMAVPLVRGEDLLGTLVVVDRQGDVSTFGREDLSTFATLAFQTTITLENLRLIDTLRSEAAVREHQALHDHLTGLPNRAGLVRRIEESIARASVEGNGFAVMLLDLNHFKDVNDTLGHQAGDELLRAIGARLSAVLPEHASGARLGGDEFAVVADQIAGAADALRLAQHVQAIFGQPFDVSGMSLRVDASLGVSIHPEHGEELASLLRRADVAMYAAKAVRGGATRLYDPTQEQSSGHRLAMANALRSAVESGALDVAFQPKATLRDGCVDSVEALARWNDPRLGPVPPDQFIPLAEQAGLMAALTDLVLTRSVRQAAEWAALGLDIAIAVNLDPRSLCEPGFSRRVMSLLDQQLVAPASLTFEITERELVEEFGSARRAIDELRSLGIRVSIDDFGTGYSALSYLTQLPVDEVKIDRSFVSSVLESPKHAAIVRAVADMSASLGLWVVAEGVEDEATWDALRDLGCDEAQGYYLSRPMAAPALTEWLLERGDLVRRLTREAHPSRAAGGSPHGRGSERPAPVPS